MNEDDRYYKTSSFYLASFLFAKDLELVGIKDTSNPRKKEFVFRDSPERERLLQCYNFAPENSPEVKIDVRKFVFAIKTLKDKIHQ